jgi:hypothetical protein
MLYLVGMLLPALSRSIPPISVHDWHTSSIKMGVVPVPEIPVVVIPNRKLSSEKMAVVREVALSRGFSSDTQIHWLGTGADSWVFLVDDRTHGGSSKAIIKWWGKQSGEDFVSKPITSMSLEVLKEYVRLVEKIVSLAPREPISRVVLNGDTFPLYLKVSHPGTPFQYGSGLFSYTPDFIPGPNLQHLESSSCDPQIIIDLDGQEHLALRLGRYSGSSLRVFQVLATDFVTRALTGLGYPAVCAPGPLEMMNIKLLKSSKQHHLQLVITDIFDHIGHSMIPVVSCEAPSRRELFVYRDEKDAFNAQL